MRRVPKAAWIIIAGGALFLGLALRPSTRPAGLWLSSPAPAFQLSDLAGRVVSLSDYKGQVVFLNFWATWCDSCREELPGVNALYSRYRKQGFVVLAPSIDAEGRRAVLPFVARSGLDFPVLLSDSKTVRAYEVFGLPTGYLIDAQGRLARKYIGAVDAKDLENDILKQLERRTL